MKLLNIKKMKGNQKGFTLAEVLIALTVMGMVGVSVMAALNASSKTIVSSHEMTIAESLTRTEMEYIKRYPYDSTNNPPVYDVGIDLSGDPYYGDYDIIVEAVRLDPKDDGTDNDDGIQKVTVKIKYHDRLLLTTEDYKVNR